jgi:outer membrane protein TolC
VFLASIIPFLVLVALLPSCSAQADDVKKATISQWSFSSYLKEFLEEDENYVRAKLDKKVSESQYLVASDLFQNTLTLQPTYLKTKTLYSDGATPNVEQSRKSLQGGFQQLLPTGTSINFEGTHFLDDVDPFLGGLNKQYNGTIEQSLWRNAFGYGSRSKRASADSNVQGFAHAEEKALLNSCINAAELYLSAYLGQEKRKIRDDAFQDSKKALDIAKRGFNQRLLRKIDYLSARADFLQVQAQQIKAALEQEKSLSTLNIRIARWTTPQLVPLQQPDDFFNSINYPKVFIKDEVPAYKESLAKVESGRYDYYALKSENRTRVNLGLSAGRSTRLGATPSSPTFTNTNNDFVQIYLKLELPVINKTQDGNIGASYYQWQKSENEAHLVEKDLRDQFIQLQIEQQRLSKELEFSKENQDIKKQQFEEAKRLLSAGKLDFVDYIRYRDIYLEEKENTLNIKSNLWQSRAKLAQYGNDFGRYCREVI